MSATTTTTNTKIPARRTTATQPAKAAVAAKPVADVVRTEIPNATKQGPYLTFVEFCRQKGDIKAVKADGSWSREVARRWKLMSKEAQQAWWTEHREATWPNVDFSQKATKSTRAASAYTYFQKAHSGLGWQPGQMSEHYKALTPEQKAPYDELAARAKAGELVTPQDIAAAKLQSSAVDIRA
jgi:hypothetical protein